MKEVARFALKVIAGIAALVFIRANPFSGNEGIAFLISIPVLVVCGGLLIWLKNKNNSPEALNRGER